MARVRLYEKTETIMEPKGVRDSQVMAIPETGLLGVGTTQPRRSGIAAWSLETCVLADADRECWT